MSGEKVSHKENSSPSAKQKQITFLGEERNVDTIDALQLMADSSPNVKQLKKQSNRINESPQVQKLATLATFSTGYSTSMRGGEVQLMSDSTEANKVVQKVAFHPDQTDKGVDLSNGGKDKAGANQAFLNASDPFTHPGFQLFSARVSKLFSEFGANLGDQPDQVAQTAWAQVYNEEKLQQEQNKLPMTDPNSGRINMEELRERHEKMAQDDILSSFSIVEQSVKTALQSQFLKAHSFAFWSGPVAKEIVLHHNGADIGLETSALGGLFDGININGKWDGALWAGLSHMYANAVITYAQGKEVRVFCSPNAALKNIYTAVEFPALKEAFENGTIRIKNYPCAPDTNLCHQKYIADGMKINNCYFEKVPDKNIEADGIPGTYPPLEGGVDKRNEAATIATKNLKKRITEKEQSSAP